MDQLKKRSDDLKREAEITKRQEEEQRRRKQELEMKHVDVNAKFESLEEEVAVKKSAVEGQSRSPPLGPPRHHPRGCRRGTWGPRSTCRRRP